MNVEKLFLETDSQVAANKIMVVTRDLSAHGHVVHCSKLLERLKSVGCAVLLMVVRIF